jgi:hypothetical protein
VNTSIANALKCLFIVIAVAVAKHDIHQFASDMVVSHRHLAPTTSLVHPHSQRLTNLREKSNENSQSQPYAAQIYSLPIPYNAQSRLKLNNTRRGETRGVIETETLFCFLARQTGKRAYLRCAAFKS